MKILITGGGTGGHLYPALAVADALKATNAEVEILFIGSERGMEKDVIPEAGYPFRALEVTGFPRRAGLRSLRAGISFWRACLAARSIVREFGPDVVFSTGGYVSAPVVVGARLAKVPIVLQEQNSVPGLTNRLAARMAAEVHLAFAGARRFFSKRRHLRLSGNPLRAQVLSGSRQRAARLFRMEEDKTTVLVLGGSQGAHSINQAVMDALPLFAGQADLQFLIQTGVQDHDAVLEAARGRDVKVWVRRFIPNMGDAYAMADLVVCRAGAMTLSELCATGLPSILIPYPHATANHQWINAEHLAEGGAALLLADHALSGPVLHETIDALLRDKRKLREMAVNALRMARPDSTARLVAALGRYMPGLVPPEPDPLPPRGRYDGPSRGREQRRSGNGDSRGERGSDRGPADRARGRSRPSGGPRGSGRSSSGRGAGGADRGSSLAPARSTQGGDR